ncbi:tape measure protein, putative [Heliomicrobium modesticaldum Ice1]|uniref:Tape measure protein, putative n=1 Tax=Heliobacterium modesticaldum (strain ATCC 51547 / Ice1) TaxID=498761 RepID=B0TI00_HELMI|nr:tape measure protein [Heliomicrobium modesticaldum]ABZ82673.1 tape measure protein, putative [Heliomicrobium modesticaldum Ice1]
MGETFRVEIPINVRDNTDPGISQATRKVSAFDRANQKTQERLEKMNRSRYQVILEALDRASSIIGHVSTKARSIAGRTYSFTMKVVDMATAPLKSIWNFATSLQGVILGGSLTAVGFKGLQLSGEMDRAKKSIDFFTGSAEEGTKAFQELVNQAIKSPLYEVPFVVQTAGQLLAAGKNIEFVKRALKDFEQTAYYTGASMSQIELAFYGFKQISAVGTLQMEELRQVTENLNLPLQWVIEELGLTGKAAKNLGDAAIPANEAMEAILKTMEKRFPAKDMQDDLLALESALKETGRMFLWAFGRGMSGPVMRIMQDLSAQLDPTGKKFNSFAGSLEYAGKVVGEKLEQIYKDVKEFLDKFNQGELKNMGLGDKLIYGIEYGLDEASKWLQGAGGKKVEKVFVEMAEIAGRAWMTALGATLKGAGNAAREGNWSGAAALGGMAWMLGAGTLLGIVGKGGKAAIAGGKGLWKTGKWLFGKGSKAADAAADAAKVAGAAAGAADDVADIAKTTKNLKDAAESFRAAANASKEAEKAVKTAEALKTAKQADLEKSARLLKELKKEAAKFGDDIPKGLSGKIMAAEKAVAKGRVDVKKAASHLDDMVNLKNLKAIDYANAREGFVVAKDVANAAKVADKAGDVAGKTGIFSKIAGWFGKSGDDVLKAGSKAAGKGIKGIPVLGTLLGLAASGAVVASAAPENRGRETAGEVGSWLGAIGAGAGAGALVGTLGGGPIGTAVGGIVGGIGGAIGGEAFTEWLYDQKDAIASMGGKVKTAISEFGTKAGESISRFFTETIPNFVTEQIPYAIGYATGSIGKFFTVTLPQVWNDLWTAVGNFFTETIPAWANGAYNTAVNFFTVSVPTFFTNLWNSVYGFFTETLPTWATGAFNKANEFFTQKVPEFFTDLWSSVSTFVTEKIPEYAKALKDSVIGWFGSFRDWASNIWDKVKSSFSAGYEAGSSGGSNVAKHAWGGIMTKPHMGIVAEDGAEGIIPLSPSKRARGLDLWWRTGELLGVRPYGNGGIAGDIPTASAVPVSVGTGNVTQYIQARVEKVEVHPAFHIEGDNLDEENVVTIIKGRIREMADDIGDELAERLARIFANMPVKGGAGA